LPTGGRSALTLDDTGTTIDGTAFYDSNSLNELWETVIPE